MCLFGVMFHGFYGIVDRVGRLLRNPFLNFNQVLTQLRFPEGSSCSCAQTTVTEAGWWAPAAQHRSPHDQRNTLRASPSPTTHRTDPADVQHADCSCGFASGSSVTGLSRCADTSIQPPHGILPLRVVGSLGCLWWGLPHHGHPESPRPTVPRAQSRWSLPDCGGHGHCWFGFERAQLADLGRLGRKR